jgi:hypothetical protein
MSVQHVYVYGKNTGVFALGAVVDRRAYWLPTMFSWRLYGPRPVSLPQGVLTGRELDAWVKWLTADGYEFKSVTAETYRPSLARAH